MNQSMKNHLLADDEVWEQLETALTEGSNLEKAIKAAVHQLDIGENIRDIQDQLMDAVSGRRG